MAAGGGRSCRGRPGSPSIRPYPRPRGSRSWSQDPLASGGAARSVAPQPTLKFPAPLEQHYQDLCDVEFTVEAGKLWMLQARVGKRSAQAAVRIAVDRALDPTFDFSPADAIAAVGLCDLKEVVERRGAAAAARRLSKGLGASPGLAVGKISLDPDEAVEMAGRGEPVILVRAATSPEGVHGMAVAEGVLTASGGLVSHAAIVAREWGKPAVVGASDIAFAMGGLSIAGVALKAGDLITIDGATGEIFLGAAAGEAAAAPDPAVATLLDWAAEHCPAGVDDPVQKLATAQAALGGSPAKGRG